MGQPAAPIGPAGQTHPLGWAPVGVGPGVTDDELARAFRRAARAAHPDLGGDAAQFDRVQRADDQARHGREVPGDGRQVSPPHGEHGTCPDRPRPWHVNLRFFVRTPAFAAKVHFALLVILCLALLTATGAFGLGGALTITVLAAPLAARPEWTEPVRATGAVFLHTSVVGIAVWAGDEIEAPLPPPRGAGAVHRNLGTAGVRAGGGGLVDALAGAAHLDSSRQGAPQTPGAPVVRRNESCSTGSGRGLERAQRRSHGRLHAVRGGARRDRSMPQPPASGLAADVHLPRFGRRWHATSLGPGRLVVCGAEGMAGGAGLTGCAAGP